MPQSPWKQNEKPQEGDRDAFLFVLGCTLFLGAAAYGLSLLLHTPLAPQIMFSGNDIAWGVIATLPPAFFLFWFSRTSIPALVSFRQSQIAFFAGIGFEFTPLRIVLMAIGAGVSEELLFRGVLQTWLADHGPLVAAIIVSNVVFGLLHFRTALYAIIAGLIGVYLGVLYALTDNLITPIITHGLYDALALEYTRRAVAAYRRENAADA